MKTHDSIKKLKVACKKSSVYHKSVSVMQKKYSAAKGLTNVVGRFAH